MSSSSSERPAVAAFVARCRLPVVCCLLVLLGAVAGVHHHADVRRPPVDDWSSPEQLVDQAIGVGATNSFWREQALTTEPSPPLEETIPMHLSPEVDVWSTFDTDESAELGDPDQSGWPRKRDVLDQLLGNFSESYSLLNATFNETLDGAVVTVPLSPLSLDNETSSAETGSSAKPLSSSGTTVQTTSTVPSTSTVSGAATVDSVTSPETTGQATVTLAPGFTTESFEEIPRSTRDSTSDHNFLQNASGCVQFTEEQLIKELKQHGTYNPDFMAWDVRGVLNFIEKASTDNYDVKKLKKSQDRTMSVEHNLAAVEQLVKELNLQNCNLRTPDVVARLYNLSLPKSADSDIGRLRTRRQTLSEEQRQASLLAKAKYLFNLYKSPSSMASRDDSPLTDGSSSDDDSKEEGVIGQAHIVSGCRKRGTSEDGYLRLCGACQAIRRLPDSFFPPFLNEVTCDEDKACLYFYDYPHGKCRQKHLNLVVLKNVGTSECQLWKRYNLNVRVSCECFVDEMSFFAKYV